MLDYGFNYLETGAHVSLMNHDGIPAKINGRIGVPPVNNQLLGQAGPLCYTQTFEWILMNLILLEETDYQSSNKVWLTGRRLAHMNEVQRVQPGDVMKVGLLNDRLGQGVITDLTGHSVEMEVTLTHEPPPALPLTLILALPRPKMMKRIIAGASSLGIKKIILINSWRVEKSFWGSPVLQPERLREHLILGLEQAGDTILPKIELKRLFKPFVLDELPNLITGTTALLAHPIADDECPRNVPQPVTLAVGPDGGFIPLEVETFIKSGFQPVHIGPRILRTETAVPFLIGRMF